MTTCGDGVMCMAGMYLRPSPAGAAEPGLRPCSCTRWEEVTKMAMEQATLHSKVLPSELYSCLYLQGSASHGGCKAGRGCCRPDCGLSCAN